MMDMDEGSMKFYGKWIWLQVETKDCEFSLLFVVPNSN